MSAVVALGIDRETLLIYMGGHIHLFRPAM